MNTIYTIAARSVQDHIATTQATLDAAALTARENLKAALKSLALDGVTETMPEWTLAQLVAATIAVSANRSDGYPDVSLPAETRAVLRAAQKAKILVESNPSIGALWFHSDFSGLNPRPKIWEADYTAWNQAATYRAENINAAKL